MLPAARAEALAADPAPGVKKFPVVCAIASPSLPSEGSSTIRQALRQLRISVPTISWPLSLALLVHRDRVLVNEHVCGRPVGAGGDDAWRRGRRTVPTFASRADRLLALWPLAPKSRAARSALTAICRVLFGFAQPQAFDFVVR